MQKRLLEIVNRFWKSKVLVIGDIMLDEYIWGKVWRISPEAPVPVVHVKETSCMPGGAGNVARNITAFKGKALLVGMIGNDLYGSTLLKCISKQGISTKGILISRKKSTIVKTRIIAHHQQVVRVDKELNSLPGRDQIKKIKEKIKELIPLSSVIILEDYGKGIITQELLDYVKTISKKENKKIILDPKKGHQLQYSGITLITPNLEEAYSMVGLEYTNDFNQNQVEEIGKTILSKWDLPTLLLTMGEHGMMVFQKSKKPKLIPTEAKEVYDVSGAGDTVVGVVALALASGADIYEASILSNIAAGIVVGKLGTAVVTEEELIGKIKER